MEEWMDGWMDEWMDGWMDGWMDEWLDGWMDGWMDGGALSQSGEPGTCVYTKKKSLHKGGEGRKACK